MLRQAAAATQKLTSAHLVLRTTGQIDALALISGGDLDVRTNPLAARGTVTYDGQVNVPFLLANDSVSVKLFDEWTRIGSVDELIPPGLLDPSRGMPAIADRVTNPQSRGTELIDGVRVLKVTGTVPADAARIMLPDTDKSHDVTAWIRDDGSHEIVRTLVGVGPGQTIETTLSNWNGAVDVAAPDPKN
jgi:lipoprotein LprG